MLLKIVSVGRIQTLPLWTSALLAGASEGLLWSEFQVVLGHFPECMGSRWIYHTQAVTAHPAQHAAQHWSTDGGIKGQHAFLTTHLIVQPYTREMFALTQTGNQLMPESMRKGSLIIQWAGFIRITLVWKTECKMPWTCFHVSSIKVEHGRHPLVLRRKSEPLIRNIVGRL